MLKKIILLVFFLVFIQAGFSYSAQYPKPEGFVNDFAGVLSPETETKIGTVAIELKEKTGAELSVTTIPDMGGLDIGTYAVELFKEWGIGSKENNDGLLIILALKERKLRIEVGYGLEHIITDATAGQIQDKYMIPYLKNNDFDSGMLQGAIIAATLIAKDKGVQLTGSVPLKQVPANQGRTAKKGFSLLQLIIIIIVFLVVSRGRGGSFLAGMLLGNMLGGGRGRYYDGGGFGGGFGGSSGFGGFGGGFSGGGGASRGF